MSWTINELVEGLLKELALLNEVEKAARNVVSLATCDGDAMRILNFEFENLETAIKTLDEARRG